MGETYRAEQGGERADGAFFDHTPTPNAEGDKPQAEGMEGGREGNALEDGDLIAGKFTSQEELVKAYEELQRKMGSQGSEQAVEEQPAEQPAPELDEGGLIQKASEKAIDIDALTAEFQQNGELSEATVEALTKRGIPREMVDAYIAGQQALADTAVDTLANTVGGREELARTLEWAGENLSDAEIDAYNEAMKAGNFGATKALLRGIRAAYEAEVGQAPRGVAGERGGVAGLRPFGSDAEMNAAIADPRYETDPAFRDEVIKRVGLMMG